MPADQADSTEDLTPPATSSATSSTEPRKRRQPREGGGVGDRGLRDIVGAGRSQIGVGGALRARDVNRPSEQDLAEADRDVVIIRRNWKPEENH
jgi:hypothetical protein